MDEEQGQQEKSGQQGQGGDHHLLHIHTSLIDRLFPNYAAAGGNMSPSRKKRDSRS